MPNGLFGLLGARPGAAPRGAPPARPAGARPFPVRQAAGGRPPFLGAPRFAEGGEVEEHKEPEVSPDLKLAAYELLECLDNHSYGDDKGGRAEALARHLLAFFHLAEAQPHEEGPHTDEGGEPGEYEDEE